MQPVSNSINGGSAAGSLRSAEELCAAVALALAVFLGASLYKHAWLIDGQGLANATDFVSLFSSVLHSLGGHPAAAYDWTMHKQAEDVALAHATDSYISWAYPPIYLFVGAGLASLPYFVAFASWIALTWSAFALTLRRIIGHRLGLILAAAFPATWFNVAIGQNGCLTAALMGGTLLLLDSQPVLAGFCLGALTYKPQFGLLFPLVLGIAGYWRTFAAATASALAIALTSWLEFGTAAWVAFFEAIPVTANAVLSDGLTNFGKLQSLFGVVRALGGSETTAWLFQIPVAAATAVVVSMIWRRPVPFELKAAALATGTLLITPYSFVYDLTILALPIAFLIRLGLRTGFWYGEPVALVAAAACILLFPVLLMPTGLVAILIVGAMILRRLGVREPDRLETRQPLRRAGGD